MELHAFIFAIAIASNLCPSLQQDVPTSISGHNEEVMANDTVSEQNQMNMTMLQPPEVEVESMNMVGSPHHGHHGHHRQPVCGGIGTHCSFDGAQDICCPGLTCYVEPNKGSCPGCAGLACAKTNYIGGGRRLHGSENKSGQQEDATDNGTVSEQSHMNMTVTQRSEVEVESMNVVGSPHHHGHHGHHRQPVCGGIGTRCSFDGAQDICCPGLTCYVEPNKGSCPGCAGLACAKTNYIGGGRRLRGSENNSVADASMWTLDFHSVSSADRMFSGLMSTFFV
jgi:hypothetical protein